MRTKAVLALVVVITGLLAGWSGSPAFDGRRAGEALHGGEQARGTAGYDHARVGEEWWFALPLPYNQSGRPLRITKVEMIDVPTGVEVVDYPAFDLDDTDGVPLLAKEGLPHTTRFSRLEDHSAAGVVVEPGSFSDAYYAAHLRITGPVRGEGRGCRFQYEQDGEKYEQIVGCAFDIKVAK
ncbi:hypothetical protein E2C00_20800 [Streptomyces sp. WAC05374]|uniref:hypothetical protein n=1 Tax=Streptomyces sp. WAC05374 TaxID=2487420 RepID=UPI000F865443|nr:hypothetical protein [Streptomyces sp. WAC05374]RST19139.1 hypothetical protein EF905_02495 [Streptomyces sp. WAC05374]TDF38092.1 hypothetical protein E2B92_28375 [Streptomyces sp. WAC05374]TDF53551.1 hypothetical protein E2C00_20800 [Streptomyces sp. WAC05374]TDF59398.1 hypothetical protein E2C02_06280 [Streptomyces sp. WAC05374]